MRRQRFWVWTRMASASRHMKRFNSFREPGIVTMVYCGQAATSAHEEPIPRSHIT
uniref:Uncharacterized protein n=1 Tax=Hyaloperonospora arabidopsidis (strain Emoy2) TaxID=559515 RepID=M4BEH1_HYAAE